MYMECFPYPFSSSRHPRGLKAPQRIRVMHTSAEAPRGWPSSPPSPGRSDNGGKGLGWGLQTDTSGTEIWTESREVAIANKEH